MRKIFTLCLLVLLCLSLFSQENKRPYINRILFNSYADLGCVFDAESGGPIFNFTAGARFNDFVFVGLNMGADASIDTWILNWTDEEGNDIGISKSTGGRQVNIPFLVNTRVFIPTNGEFYPFFDLAIGPDVFILPARKINDEPSVSLPNGRWLRPVSVTYCKLILKAGVGLDWKRLSVGAGIHVICKARVYNYGSYDDSRDQVLGYFKVGVRIGPMK